jgi:hypothetical protein
MPVDKTEGALETIHLVAKAAISGCFLEKDRELSGDSRLEGRLFPVGRSVAAPFFMLLVGFLLAGCDARREFWERTTGTAGRAFLAVVPCSLDQLTYPAMASRRYFAITASQELPREQQRVLRVERGIQIVDSSLPPVPFSLTAINERGAQQSAKLFIAHYEDTAARYYVKRPLWQGGVPSREALRPGEVCVSVTNLPWQTDRNRPYWVADNLLQANAAAFEGAHSGALFVILGLAALFIAGTIFAGVGYFDAPEMRGTAVKRSLLFAAGSLAVLLCIRWYSLSDAIDALPEIQGYYRFYGSLPRAGEYLMPLSGETARRLFAGPPSTNITLTSVNDFWAMFAIAALIVAAVFLMVFGKRIYMGTYWLFVPHPAAAIVLPALHSDQKIDAKGLARTLAQGATDTGSKSTVEYEVQAEKARRLKEKLDADAEIAEATIRRERARAALEDAEREVAEAKYRSGKTR